MKRNPEQLAWIILLASFFTCIALSVATPLSIRWYIRNARIGQQVVLEVQKAPLSVTLAGRGRPISVAEDRDHIPEGTVIKTNSTSGRFVIYRPQNGEEPPLATLQIYNDTEATLTSAHSPRFVNTSHLPHQIGLDVKRGRVRINILGSDDRATVVRVETEHGYAVLNKGRFTIEVDRVTQISVQEGVANIIGSEHNSRLIAEECAIMEDGSITGPLPTARDMIVNGDFSEALENGWTQYNKDIQIEEEGNGTVEIVEVEGRPAAAIKRIGEGHAETGIRQQIDFDIRDFDLLQLYLLLRIEEQSLPVCGSEGSECPLMVRIDYKDAYGANREWLQGFYWLPNVEGSENPLVCRTCSTHSEHVRVPRNTWYAYLSPNLIPRLSQEGHPPTAIDGITIYSSGHTYHAVVAEVELIGQE